MIDKTVLRFFFILAVLLLVSLACGLPFQTQPEETTQAPESAPVEVEDLPPTSTIPPPPTPTAQPLPPTLVEADPPPGVDLPLNGVLTFYFDQPMDRGSVEGALRGEPQLSGHLSWLDDATLVFEPDSALDPSTVLTVELDTTALAANGLAMLEPVRLKYRTASPLRAVQVLPEPGIAEADPSSAIVTTFDQPVVPLGADPETLPTAFSIEPAANGTGEWINTSTFVFYPDPPLVGGTTYQISLNTGLLSTSGGPFIGIAQMDGDSWSFSTASPSVRSVIPDDGTVAVPIDTVVELNFNQSMDSASVQQDFVLLDPDGFAVGGVHGWNDDFSTMVFTPTSYLERDTRYTIRLAGSAQSLGGTPLEVDYEVRFDTVPSFYVSWTEPVQGGSVSKYQGAKFNLSAPVDTSDPLEYISVSPAVTNLDFWTSQSDFALNIIGDFKPNTDYQVTLSGSLPDRWGQNLGQDYVLRFRTEPLRPALVIAYGESQLFITPQDTTLSAQAASIQSVDLSIGNIPPNQFWQYLGPAGYDALQNTTLPDAQYWTVPLDISDSRISEVQLPLTPNGAALPPGLYHYRVTAPEMESPTQPFLIVSSYVHLTFKLSATQVFVWAVDLRNGNPVVDAPITVFDPEGNPLTNGSTDEEGVFQAAIPVKPDIFGNYYTVLGASGDDYFSLAFSNWNSGLQGYEFGVQTDYRGPHTFAYIYTDRPIYRPGQTVHFRTIVRHARNGRYTMPDIGILPINVTDGNYQPLLDLELPLSEYGSAQGQFTLSDEAVPGYYTIISPHGSLTFQVSEYRKPEIDLQVSASPNPAISGQTITAQVEARYFFGAPAGDVPLTWTVHAIPEYFALPGYSAGTRVDDGSYPAYARMSNPYGKFISSGDGRTGSDGLLAIEIPTTSGDPVQRYVIEVTLQDESGLPVSNQAEVVVHPAEFYIGVRPDAWISTAGDEISFEIKVVDWERNTAGSQDLNARFRKVTWVRSEKEEIYDFPTYTPVYIPISSSDFRTGADGTARLAFSPPEPGAYELEISAGTALTQITMWVVGEGQVAWPNLPNQQLTLTSDRQTYSPGDTAKILIPNPLGEGAQALVTIERGEVLRHQVIEIDSNGYTFNLPLGSDDAPNVYLVVTLIGTGSQERFDFRQGILNLEVDPVEQTLQVSLTPQPQQAGPQDEVSFTVLVTDADGRPVQGEFSLAIIDKAVLSLADPFEAGIVDAFYGTQPLGVRTGLSLAAYAHRFVDIPGGLGGGGGGEIMPPSLRESFQDTAYWNAAIITDAAGQAVISLRLPDNLTTWSASTRGLTIDTRVGESSTEIIATKDLLIRPVTPRFLVVGDHLRLTGIVHNNTENDLTVDVRLQATGFALDNPSAATQNIAIPAGGRLPVAWWGTVESVDSVDLIFSADTAGLSDMTRPLWGDLPVLRYTAPQTFATAGTMDSGGERLEVISLPRTFDPDGGDLRLVLAPSLAAAILPGLDVLEHYPYECTEQTLSRFLPNLEAYRAVQELGLEAPDLEARLQRTLDQGLQRLAARQNDDGGWGWWSASWPVTNTSDPYITSYVLFGLSQARAAGIFVDEVIIQQAVNFLSSTLPSTEMLSEPWQLDRLAFQLFALSQAGSASNAQVGRLYESRDQLGPWAQAFLALTLETLSPADPRIREIYAGLEAAAIRSATGVHWEGHAARINMETPAFNTAVVIYALAQHDPASPTISDAVRYLMAARTTDGAWASTYETAWAIMSLTEVMKGTGELAGDYQFTAALNGIGLIESDAGGDVKLNPVSASVPVSSLYPTDPNALILQRGDGPGKLYYTAHLNVLRPVEDVTALDRGMTVSRWYETLDGRSLMAGSDILASVGEPVVARLAITLKNAAYYLVVEDFIPAGAELVDTDLNTSQQFSIQYDPRDPFNAGWGWWYFNDPQIFDERIAWSVDYLPAGTYELTYIFLPNQPGDYRVLPARAWEFYFPEVQGNSAGELVIIQE